MRLTARVSSERTRARILAAARELLEKGDAQLAMGRIARAAGVTRQLLYLYFDGRADLLLQLTRAIDEDTQRASLQDRVDSAPDGRTALRETVHLQGRILPHVTGIGGVLDRLRATDPDAALVWQARQQARLERARRVVARIAAEGRLRPGLDAEVAAHLVWSATSLRAWCELVEEAGWTTEQWVAHTTDLLDHALLDHALLG